jgi:hypothetical protein
LLVDLIYIIPAVSCKLLLYLFHYLFVLDPWSVSEKVIIWNIKFSEFNRVGLHSFVFDSLFSSHLHKYSVTNFLCFVNQLCCGTKCFACQF